MISIRKITKGNNSAKKKKNVGGVTVVNLCMSSAHFPYRNCVHSITLIPRLFHETWTQFL